MKKIVFLIISLIMSAEIIYGQPYNFPPLKGYKIISKYPVYIPDDLWDFIDGAADGYLSYGFENVHVREYQKGKDIIKVEIYRHKDRNNTFGIYSSERSPSYRFITIGAQGYIADEGSLNFFKGCYYVKMRTYSGKEKVQRVMESLALRIADMLPGDASMPKTVTEFPDNNRVKNSERYINESVLGHEYLNRGFQAEYQIDGTTFNIILIDKETAAETAKTAASFLAGAGLEPNSAEEGKYCFRDGYNGDIFLAWRGTRMVIISGLAKDQSAIADRYTGEILR